MSIPSVANLQPSPSPRDRGSRWRSVDALVAFLFAFVVATMPEAARAQAQGQEEVDPFAGVEEMIVVGGGTAALLAPQSTSAIAFDTGELDAYGVDDISDIAAYVPNLEISSQNATNASFFVRGVGLQDFGANASSSVPIFQDGVPRNPSATQLVGLFDVGALTVLRGPQGSGNFRNASAGAIVVQAAKPEPEFSGFAKVALSRLVTVDARDANRYNFEAAMNAPVVGDIISMRVSARYKHENPFFENGCANRTPIIDRPVQSNRGRDPVDGSLCGDLVRQNQRSIVTPYLSRWQGEVDDFGFRGQVRIQPPDTPLDVTFRVELSRMNRDSVLGQHIGTAAGVIGRGDGQYVDRDISNRVIELTNAFEQQVQGITRPQARTLAEQRVSKELLKRPLDTQPYRGDFDSPGRLIVETHIATMSALADLDEFDIKVNFGYVDYRLSEARDTDLSPNIRFPSNANDQAWELYGDIELSGENIGDLPLEWDTGLYTMVETVEAFQLQQLRIAFEADQEASFTQEIYSFGLFAKGRYEFLEAFTLAAGLRYNWERKDFEVGRLRIPLQGSIGTTVGAASRNQRTWDSLTGFAEIRYAFTEEIATYFKYSKGFKAGHFNPSRPSDAKDPSAGFADPEEIDSFEWGLDYGIWSGRVNGKAAFFFYNYENYQVFRLTSSVEGIFRDVQNANKARNYGVEFEISINPLEGYAPEAIERLNLKFSAGWLRTNYVEFTNSEERSFAGGNIGVTIDYSGNALINAPELQFTGTVLWPLMVGKLGTFTPQYDFTWTDDTPFDPNNGRGEVNPQGEDRLPPYLIGNRAYILHNVRLTWSPPGDSGITVAGWCRNVADKRYKTFSVDISTFNNQILNFVADPRSCGADFRFTW